MNTAFSAVAVCVVHVNTSLHFCTVQSTKGQSPKHWLHTSSQESLLSTHASQVAITSSKFFKSSKVIPTLASLALLMNTAFSAVAVCVVHVNTSLHFCTLQSTKGQSPKHWLHTSSQESLLSTHASQVEITSSKFFKSSKVIPTLASLALLMNTAVSAVAVCVVHVNTS